AAKAEAASSRDSVAPVATLPIIDFRSSIAPTVASIVVGARHLREGGLVDGRADDLLDLVHVLRDLLLGEPALQAVLQPLDLVGGHVDRRHGDVGDLEDGPFAAHAALPDAILRRAERRRDRARWHAGNGSLALEILGALDFRPDGCRLVGKIAALFEL